MNTFNEQRCLGCDKPLSDRELFELGEEQLCSTCSQDLSIAESPEDFALIEVLK